MPMTGRPSSPSLTGSSRKPGRILGNPESMTNGRMRLPAGFNEFDRLADVALRVPMAAWRSQDLIERQWQDLDYRFQPDLEKAQLEYRRLIDHLRQQGTRIHFFPEDVSLSLDCLYVRDASIVAPDGMILCAMGKRQRRREALSAARYYEQVGIPIAGRIEADGLMEGGDVIWLDRQTVLVGEGYRTNRAGIDQLRAILGSDIQVLPVPLPHWKGEQDVFHLMSVISPLDADLLLVYSPLLPVTLRQFLLNSGFVLIDVADEEFGSMAGNVLALGPRQAVMLSGNPVTEKRLRQNGVQLQLIDGQHMSTAGCGGPTCLTRPLSRIV